MSEAKENVRQSGIRLCLLEAAAKQPAVTVNTDPATAARTAIDIAEVWYSYVVGSEEQALDSMFE